MSIDRRLRNGLQAGASGIEPETRDALAIVATRAARETRRSRYVQAAAAVAALTLVLLLPVGLDRLGGEDRRIEAPVLLPLGEEHNHVGPGRRFRHGVHDRELRARLAGVVRGLGVGDHHLGAALLEQPRHVQRRRVADVVAVGLERGTQHRDPQSRQRAAQLADQVHRPLPAAEVDPVDLGQEVDGRADAQLVGPGAEGPDVLG